MGGRREWREGVRKDEERVVELLERVYALNSGSKVSYLLSSQGFLLGDPYQSL
jgi:hypothetical protein